MSERVKGQQDVILPWVRARGSENLHSKQVMHSLAHV